MRQLVQSEANPIRENRNFNMIANKFTPRQQPCHGLLKTPLSPTPILETLTPRKIRTERYQRKHLRPTSCNGYKASTTYRVLDYRYLGFLSFTCCFKVFVFRYLYLLGPQSLRNHPTRESCIFDAFPQYHFRSTYTPVPRPQTPISTPQPSTFASAVT